MLRRVILLRHGHAEERSDDYGRQLSERGKLAASSAAQALLRSSWLPELILTSPAPRARATAQLVAGVCGPGVSLVEDGSLYLATESRYSSALQEVPESVRCVLVVGHNPGLSQLARALCRHPRELAPAEFATRAFELDAWSELDAQR